MDITVSHCNSCLGKRNHESLHTYRTEWEDEEDIVDGWDDYELLKCCGCGRVSLRHSSYFSENRDYSNGEFIPEVIYYPPAISRPRPSWCNQLQSTEGLDFLRQLLNEIYIGLQNGTTCMAIMAIRALLEFIMIKEVGDQGSFGKNILEFQKKEYITTKQKEFLDIVLEAGHATIHRSHQATKEDLEICMDIMEMLIVTTYIHPSKTDKLKKRIPKRKK